MFKPKKIMVKKTIFLNEEVGKMTHPLVKLVVDTKLRIYCVDQNCGTSYYKHHVVTVPFWVFFKEDQEFYIYYLCHELSHAVIKIINPTFKGHGKEFMEVFKKICPEHLQHYEIEYKPRLAVVAGINRKGESEMSKTPLKTVGEYAREMLCQGKSTDDILDGIEKNFPDSVADGKSVAFYRYQLRKEGRLPKVSNKSKKTSSKKTAKKKTAKKKTTKKKTVKKKKKY